MQLQRRSRLPEAPWPVPPAQRSDEEPSSSLARWRSRLRHPAAEALLVLALVGVAFWIRYPNLWLIPRITDEWKEARQALVLARGQGLPLTNHDAYQGALWNYLLALADVLLGPDVRLPRLLALLLGTLTVVPVYLLGREWGGWRAGLVAGLLMATSPLHVLVNSHIAWSHSATPLFTTTGCWLVVRAARRRSGRALGLAGLAGGLAFQTHPTALLLAPGALAYLWLRARSLLQPRWLALAAALFVVGCANEALFVVTQPTEYQAALAGARTQYHTCTRSAVDCYRADLAFFGLSLARLPSGVGLGANDEQQPLRDPLTWLFALPLLGAALLAARRGEPLALTVTPPALLLLALAQPASYHLVPEGRYTMPLLPLFYASLGLVLTRPPRWLPPALPLLAGCALALVPLVPLQRAYVGQGRATYQRIWDTVVAVQQQTPAGWSVVIDPAVQRELDHESQRDILGVLGNAGFSASYQPVSTALAPQPETIYLLGCDADLQHGPWADSRPLTGQHGRRCQVVQALAHP